MAQTNNLVDLSVHEVTLCKDPANDGARLMLFKSKDVPGDIGPDAEAYMKRDFSADDRKRLADSGEAMPDGGFPIENKADLKNAIQAIGRAKDPAAAKKHIISRAKALGASDLIPDDWKASKAGRIIEALKALIGVGKSASEIEAALRKFDVAPILAQDTDGDIKMFDGIVGQEEVQRGIWDANSAVCQSVLSIIGDDEVDAGGKQSLLQETLREFTNHMLQLVGGAVAKYAPPAQGEPGAMATEALKKSLGLPADASDADVEKAVARLDALSKLSAAERGYIEKSKLDGEATDKFAAMTAAERKALMDKNPPPDDDADDAKKALAKGDAFTTPEGAIITKAQVGEGIFAVLKAQNDRITAQADELAKSRDRTELMDISKRVEPLIHIGKADEIASILQRVGKADTEAAKQVETLFKGLNEQIAKGELFKEHGSGQGGAPAEATAAIDAQARELMKSDPKLSIEKARTRVRDTHPDLAKREQEERSAASRRAA